MFYAKSDKLCTCQDFIIQASTNSVACIQENFIKIRTAGMREYSVIKLTPVNDNTLNTNGIIVDCSPNGLELKWKNCLGVTAFLGL